MFTLMNETFVDVRREAFERDLAEKPWVFLIRDEQGTVQGFSTLCPLETKVEGERIAALFSGDTVLNPRYWGHRPFVREVTRHIVEYAAERTDVRVYWLLLTCTFRSYRLMRGMLQHFYPQRQEALPESVRQHRDALVRLKFPSEYDATRGVVTLDHPTPFRDKGGEITPHSLDDPDVAYFVSANPHHARGDFLCCIAEIRESNLTPLAKRLCR